jgi:alcohol dehydrogenase
MKALVYHGPGRKDWEEVPDPVVIDGTDAVVRVDATTICGTDLHILKGDVPAVTEGRILSHGAVGTIVAVGDAVQRVHIGDRVLVSRITSSGNLPVLPRRSRRAVPRRRWLDPRPQDRRDAGRDGARPVRRSVDLPGPAGVSDEAVLLLADIRLFTIEGVVGV